MIITVTQLNNFLKGVIDSETMLSNLEVKGEICNLRQSYDNAFFTVKDEFSSIDCYAYANREADLSLLQNGKEVVLLGTPSFYAKTAKMSFNVKKITFSDKDGKQYLAFLKLKEELKAQGLFEESRKKPLNCNCINIGVVTSAKGAVIGDIVNVSQRRNPAVEIFLYPAKVQGEGAEKEIIEGIKFFERKDVDVVIVARGGGSDEDLSAFNSKNVVLALAKCSKPTLSAIGHGIDWTLCDFAADARASTPSEAAELVTTNVSELKSRCKSTLQRMYALLAAKNQSQSSKYKYLSLNAYSLCSDKIAEEEKLFASLAARLDGCNVLKKLSGGFGYITHKGERLLSVEKAAVGEELEIFLADGSLRTEIKDIKKNFRGVKK